MKFVSRRWLVNGLLIGSLLLNVSIIAYLAKSGGLRRIFLKMDLVELPKTREDFQKEAEARYRKYPNTDAEVVFAGDSLIADGPWSEFYSEIHNRGIGGETTSGFLGRLDEILDAKPAQIFLHVGTNDLASTVPEAQLLRNYRQILERIHKESPKTEVTALAIFPVNLTFPKPPTQSNEEIRSANRRLENLVKEFPGDKFLDLTAFLADEAGNLRREFTRDGIHLNVDGYLAIRKPLQEAAKR